MEGDSKPGVNLLWVGVLVEGGLLFAALVLGRLGLYDHLQPLNLMDASDWKSGVVWGLIATGPMLIYLCVLHFWTPRFLQPMRQIVETKMKPLFADSTTFELFILALMAGFGEELFFRWCLQGGVTSLLAPQAGEFAAIGIGVAVASLIFGVCHWVNAAYGMTTLVVGVYLGAIMVWSANWLVPAIAHAFFDFIALVYIVRMPTKQSDQ